MSTEWNESLVGTDEYGFSVYPRAYEGSYYPSFIVLNENTKDWNYVVSFTGERAEPVGFYTKVKYSAESYLRCLMD